MPIIEPRGEIPTKENIVKTDAFQLSDNRLPDDL